MKMTSKYKFLNISGTADQIFSDLKLSFGDQNKNKSSNEDKNHRGYSKEISSVALLSPACFSN
jgi:hypothetical protein